jgi:hypothetical protein
MKTWDAYTLRVSRGEHRHGVGDVIHAARSQGTAVLTACGVVLADYIDHNALVDRPTCKNCLAQLKGAAV